MPLDISAETTTTPTHGATQGWGEASYGSGWSKAVAILVNHARYELLEAAEQYREPVIEYVDTLGYLSEAWHGAAAAATAAELRQLEFSGEAASLADVDLFDWVGRIDPGTGLRLGTAWNAVGEATTWPWSPPHGTVANHIVADPGTPDPASDLASLPQRQGRYPLLAKALEAGQITGAGLPARDSRRLRVVDEEPVSEEAQVGFGRSGEPPTGHLRRTTLR